MTWAIELSAAAEKDLKRIPRDRQVRIERAIDEMEGNPFAGDVKALQGREWKGRYRKRVGQYRIIFTVDHKTSAVAISAILIRSEKTYR
ncbi:MAG: type II toxin-antitoxin system RelE family toxin [Candidatus Korobacteraceae bacterium]|jgi:mRNA-degrading endonuclease RelE of RelBE toxin-antitoxin system